MNELHDQQYKSIERNKKIMDYELSFYLTTFFNKVDELRDSDETFNCSGGELGLTTPINLWNKLNESIEQSNWYNYVNLLHYK
jgi:hypothetical protein